MFRATVSVVVVAVLGCSSSDQQQSVAARRDSIGAPTVAWRPPGNAFPRFRATSGAVPLPDGLLVFDDEPWLLTLDGGQRELVDVTPGSLPTWDGNNSPSAVGTRAYFLAGSSTQGRGVVWETDGTVAGTRELALAGDLDLTELQASPWGLVFSGRASSGDRTRLSTDAGIVPLGTAVNLPLKFFTELPGRLLFFDSSDQLYAADGSDAGTVTLRPPALFRPVPPLLPHAGTAWFIGNDSGNRLWRTDGTVSGTTFSGVPIDNVTGLMTWRGALVLTGRSQSSTAVWLTSGAADAGASSVYGAGASLNSATLLGAGPTHLYFNAAASGSGSLFAADGTDGGVVALGNPVSTNTLMVGDLLLFERAGEPWRTDGTTAGTQSIAPGVTLQGSFVPLPGVGAVFVGTTAAEGDEPFVTDGTVAGTRRLADLLPGSGDGVNGRITAVDAPYAWFSCNLPSNGNQLCVTDGTPAGTRPVKPTPGSANPTALLWSRRVGGRLVLRDSTRHYGFTPGLGVEALGGSSIEAPVVSPSQNTAWFVSQGALWRTDGTDAGTRSVGTPSASLAAGTRFVVGDEFAWASSGENLVRYRSDAGFELPLSGFTQPPTGFQLRDLTAVGDELAFFATTGTSQRDLLLSGASDGGLRPLATAYTVTPEHSMVMWNGALYFQSPSTGVLRFSPGDGGVDMAVNAVNSFFGTLHATASTMYLATGINPALYRTDGTDAGTRLLAAFQAMIAGPPVAEFVPVAQGALLIASPRILLGQPSTVWWTDGTSAGTVPLPVRTQSQRGLATTQTLRDALEVPGFGVFLPVWTPETGLEPGFFDPTTGVATVLADVWPGPRTSAPRDPAVIGNELYFLADDGTGQALFGVDLLGTMPVDAGTGGGGGSGATGGGGGASGGGSGSAGGGGDSAGGGAAEGGGAQTGGGGDATPPGCGCQPMSVNAAWLLVASALRRRAPRIR